MTEQAKKHIQKAMDMLSAGMYMSSYESSIVEELKSALLSLSDKDTSNLPIPVSVINSTRDGFIGFIEKHHPSGDEYRRVFIQSPYADGLEHCTLEVFNRDGTASCGHSTTISIEDLEIG